MCAVGSLLYNGGVKNKLPHPFICKDVPRFNTQHEVVVFIEMYKSKGHIKRCTHLEFGEIGTGGYATDYTPKCRKDSFIIQDEGINRSAFYGCDRECRLYEPVWWGKPKRWLKKQWWPFRRFVVGTAEWFASLGHITQVIFALALLALVSTPWRGTIVDILKIIYSGK